jgi:putative copper resistance protein D
MHDVKPTVPPVAPAAIATSRIVVAAALLASVVVLAAVLALGGGGRTGAAALPGLSGPGPATAWGLPLARLVLDLASVLAVGFVLLAVLIPARRGGELSGTSLRALRVAAGCAAAWSLAAWATLALTSSDFSGLPLPSALHPDILGTVIALPAGLALVVVALAALALAACAGFVLTVNGGALLLLAAVLTLVPPALTGHAAGATDHDLAVTSLAAHVVAGALWVGGLLALVLLPMRHRDQLAAAVARYSTVALWCFVVVATSGAINAWVRLGAGAPADLVTTAYGRVVLLKILALVLLGAAGWWHRARTLPRLSAGSEPGAFRRIAQVEASVMVVTVALAVGLSRTPPPVPDTLVITDLAETLLGFPMPLQFSLTRLVTESRPDLFFLLLAGVLAVLYARAVHTLHRRGDRWPLGRTLAWASGLVVLTVATSSGLSPYGRVLFSAHMVQHMLLAMVAPLCLVLGAPVTLALRALPAGSGDGDPGLRGVILAAVHSWPARLLANPVVALAIFVVSLYGTYFTGLFELGMRSHVGHVLMHLHFIAAGYIFYSMVIGTDPAPSRPPHIFRIIALFAAMVFHAFFGVAVMGSSTLLAAGWFNDLARPWGPSPLADQGLAGSIAWSFGELPTLGVLAALFVQWVRADEREARRGDRAAERTAGTDADELEAYNRYLADLAERGRRG